MLRPVFMFFTFGINRIPAYVLINNINKTIHTYVIGGTVFFDNLDEEVVQTDLFVWADDMDDENLYDALDESRVVFHQTIESLVTAHALLLELERPEDHLDSEYEAVRETAQFMIDWANYESNFTIKE